MNNSAVYSHRGAIAKSSVGSGPGGGDVEDVLKRLGNVETAVTDLKAQVTRIETVIPGLATAASVARIEAIIPALATAASVARIEAIIPTLATKADLSTLETMIIKWMIGTVLSSTALAFSIAKLVH